jgi:hypothetical protein
MRYLICTCPELVRLGLQYLVVVVVLEEEMKKKQKKKNRIEIE